MAKTLARPVAVALSAAVLVAAVLAALALKAVSYLLFHTVAELFSIVIAESVFLIAFATRRLEPKASYGILGLSLGTVGLIDIVHTLAYKGMGLLPVDGANRATQLWIAGRILLALSLLVAVSLAGRTGRFRFPWAAILYALAGIALVTSIFTGLFPACYVEGQGLTAFKKGSEYGVMALLAAAIAILLAKRRHFAPEEIIFLVPGLACLIAAEFFFTLYIGVYDLSNFLGHLVRIAGYYFLVRALVLNSLTTPLTTLFRDADRRIAELTELNARIASMRDELVRNEKLAFLGKLSATMAHQINTPLGAISSLSRGSREVLDACLPEIAGLAGQQTGEGGEWFLSHARPAQGRASAGKAEAGGRSLRARREAETGIAAALGTDDARSARLAPLLAELGLDAEEVRARPGFYAGPEVASLAGLARDMRLLAANEELVLDAVSKAEKALLALRGYTDAAAPNAVRDCNLAALVDAVLEAHRASMEGNVKVDRDYQDSPEVAGVPELLSLVFDNLVLNALQAMGWRGRLSLGVKPEGDQVVVSLRDDGPGIPLELQPRVFEPFFTTRPQAEGLGLGLDLSRRIVTDHGGSIDFESDSGGTLFRVRLPMEKRRSGT